MDSVGGRIGSSTLKFVLYGLGAAGGLVLLSLVFGALSASAETPNESPSSPSSPSATSPTQPPAGLLGTLGATVNAVTAPVTKAVDAVAPVESIPDSSAATVADVSLSRTLAPVTGLADKVVSSVPVVGHALSSTLGSVSSVIHPVIGAVDSAVSTVGVTTAMVTTGVDRSVVAAASLSRTVGTPAPAVVTSSRARDAVSSEPNPRDLVFFADTASNPTSATPGTVPRSGMPGSPVPVPTDPVAPVNGSGSTTILGGAGGSPGRAAFAGVLGMATSAALASYCDGRLVNDELPSTPTYDTDSSPD